MRTAQEIKDMIRLLIDNLEAIDGVKDYEEGRTRIDEGIKTLKWVLEKRRSD